MFRQRRHSNTITKDLEIEVFPNEEVLYNDEAAAYLPHHPLPFGYSARFLVTSERVACRYLYLRPQGLSGEVEYPVWNYPLTRIESVELVKRSWPYFFTWMSGMRAIVIRLDDGSSLAIGSHLYDDILDVIRCMNGQIEQCDR